MWRTARTIECRSGAIGEFPRASWSFRHSPPGLEVRYLRHGDGGTDGTRNRDTHGICDGQPVHLGCHGRLCLAHRHRVCECIRLGFPYRYGFRLGFPYRYGFRIGLGLGLGEPNGHCVGISHGNLDRTRGSDPAFADVPDHQRRRWKRHLEHDDAHA